jgi:hypothetical protein
MPGGQAAKQAARWYTPSLEGNTPFPATPISIPTPPVVQEAVPKKKPRVRLQIVVALALTVALVLAAVLANYFSP